MDMLTDKDITRIGEEVGKVIEDNVLPQLEVIVEEKLKPIRATMVTKDYLDEKFATVNGKVVVLADILHRNGAITGEQRGAVRTA